MIARRRLLLTLPLAAGLPALGGCGWEPLYADKQTDAASADLRAIKVEPIPDRYGQQLEFALRQSLNPSNVPTKPLYSLKVTLKLGLQSLSIQSQGLGTRGEFTAIASYQLNDLVANKGLQGGWIHANDSFDIQANGYTTLVAEDDAKRRTIEEICRDIVARLTLFMQNRPATVS